MLAQITVVPRTTTTIYYWYRIMYYTIIIFSHRDDTYGQKTHATRKYIRLIDDSITTTIKQQVNTYKHFIDR
jgi:hypothetical protein